VPFYLRTGKRVIPRHTEIVIQFLGVPHSAFGNGELIPNRLTITLQPEERISLLLMNKSPSLTAEGIRLSPLSLNLSLTEAFRSQRRRIAYERLLLDALAGDATLFVRDDEVEAAWAWTDGIERAWRETETPVEFYPAGSRGPAAANALIASRGYSWAE
jgi:glucose-6-phosphate 1-dehydrogenase